MKVVNSHNEWDPLKEVVVGSGIPSTLPLLDYTFKLFFHDNIYDKKENIVYEGPNGSQQHEISRQHVEEHEEDINNFADVLTSIGVKVRRPKIPKKINNVKTPFWESTDHVCLNVRDLTLIVGDRIIETPSTCRWRYFENEYLKHLFNEYMSHGARWIKAPTPLMLDSSFDLSYIDRTPGAREYYESQLASHPDEFHVGFEMMFDAANCMRLGKHILFNTVTKNSDAGVKWLQSYLGDEYTVWPVQLCDSHIDTSFVPLRPGLMLLDRPDILHKLPEPLQKWDVIYNPRSYDRPPQYQSSDIRIASDAIDINLLMVNPELAIVQERNINDLEPLLRSHGIECLPVPIRHDQLFAGGHHCTTLDICREGDLEDYFA